MKTKPFIITEEGKDKPFIWCEKKMNFRARNGAKLFLVQLKKDYPYLKFEIKYEE
jgi:hypothetical protein